MFLQNSIRFCRNQFRFPRTTRPLLRNQKTLLQNEIRSRENVRTFHRNENSFRRNDFSFSQNIIMICCCQNHLVVDGDDDHAEATTAERIEKDLGPRVGHTDRRVARSAAANRASAALLGAKLLRRQHRTVAADPIFTDQRLNRIRVRYRHQLPKPIRYVVELSGRGIRTRDLR